MSCRPYRPKGWRARRFCTGRPTDKNQTAAASGKPGACGGTECSVKKKIVSVAGIFALPVVLFLFFSLVCEGFGFHTAQVVVSQSLIPTVLGLAMAPVMMCGLMDFSSGARVILGAAVGAVLGNSLGVPGFLIGCIAGAFAGGFVIAFLYRILRIPSMVVSMGVVLVMEVASYKLSEVAGTGSAVKFSEAMINIGSWPKNLILVAVACVISYLIQYKTSTGCQIMACGNDEVMLKNMGVNTGRLKFIAFALSGIFCAFGAVIQSCYSGQVTVAIGMVSMSMVFKPMMGVLIGMQLLRLVDNMPLMIFIGELTISIIFNGFIALGLTDNLQNIVLGVFLLLVLGISGNTANIVEHRRKQAVRKAAGSQA